jgi:hypothetical protein
LSLHAEYNRSVAAVRAQLGVAAFDTAWAAGRTLPLDAAISAALDFCDEDGIATPTVADSSANRPSSA